MNKADIPNGWNKIFRSIEELNPGITEHKKYYPQRSFKLQKVLVANRGEIAKRFFFALHEEGIPSVAIITDPDIGQSWYDFAGEVVHIGDSLNYSSMDTIIAAAIISGANAVYPGYGFLSENPTFVRRIHEASEIFGREIIFMGPKADVMESIGDKVRARILARANGISLFDGADNVISVEQGLEAAHRTGYPVMVKLSAGGGGRGIIPCYNDDQLLQAIEDVQRVGEALFKDRRFFIEKLVEKPVHIEAQIFNGYAIGLRKCAVQRRHQKIIEESAQTLVDDSTALFMLAQAQIIAKISGYADGCGVGTVEYLFDPDTESFGFLEVNTRLQVEYAVTEQSLGIDLVKWQIALFDGRESEIPIEEALRNRLRPPSHAIECRVYAEDPADGYRPAPGLITEVALPTFNGVRCDFGFVAQDRVASMYDAMIGKVIAYGSTRDECIIRLERALQEIYVRGLHTNIKQLLSIVRHPEFYGGKYTNKILEEFPELCLPSIDDSAVSKTMRKGRSTVVLGTLTEYIRLIRRKSNAFVQSLSFDVSMGRRGIMFVPYRFTVEYNQVSYEAAIYSVSLEKYYVVINGRFNGEVYLISSNISRGEYIFRYGNGSYRLRVDRRTKYFSIRIKDSDNKVNYYRLSVFPAGTGEQADPKGMIRSPFQCTFVSLADDGNDPSRKIHTGSFVQKGDLLLVISSMKMETRIFSPVDGRIEYLIEDGNIGRLVLGATSDGRILGKGIQEGDVLVIVKPVNSLRSLNEKFGVPSSSSADLREKASTEEFAYYGMESMLLSKPEKFMPFMIESLHGGIGGFIQRPNFLSDMNKLFDRFDEDEWRHILTPEIEISLCSLITFYYSVLQLFSPIVRSDGFSFQEGLNYYIRNLDNYDYKPEPAFKALLMSVFDNYGIKELKPSLEGENNMNPVAFFNLQNAYFICSENKALIRKLIRVLSYSENRLEATERLLENIIAHEQAEPDDSIAKFAGKVLASKFTYMSDSHAGLNESSEGLSASEFVTNAMALDTVLPEKILFEAAESLKGNSKESSSPPAIADKISILAKKTKLLRLFSPYENIALYSSVDADGSHYIAFALVKDIEAEKRSDVNYSIINIEILADAAEKACRLLALYNLIKKSDKNRLELIATDTILRSDPVSNGIGFINFNGLMGLSSVAGRYLSVSGGDSILFYFDVAGRDGEGVSKVYKLQKRDAGFELDLLAEKDPRNPYNASHLYNMKKWPVEIWAAETFDGGDFEELFIDTVDFRLSESVPVASKIFKGKLNGRTVCFYMKDSRINGGATGDLEGLKYAAAVYIAYRSRWPLYVWNDGAGANVNQGVVSINRGGEGFMMNAISCLRPREFFRYINGCQDPRLTELFISLDERFFNGERSESIAENKESFYFMTAVGIGSSAGLDVYGSSQAPLQIILDNEQSYRTLTGAGIIRMTTGEKISNYEIGGARVMSKWAGIVDLVANGKNELISDIRRINDMFSFEEDLPCIKRLEGSGESANDIGHFSEADIRANVDDNEFLSLKQDYYGGGSVVAGFAKIGGRRTVILGPRSREGLRSYQSVIRAHDVLRTGQRLAIPAVLVISGKWHQHTDLYDGPGVRGRTDFINVLSSYTYLKICIVTDINGFHCLEILSGCDIVIFVSAGMTEIEHDFIERNAAFTAASLREAFDIVHRLICFIDPINSEPREAGGVPDIPDDPVMPYDMISSVIHKITDNGEFLEFFAAMNSSENKPNFITGLGRLNGLTVAVMADQPLVLGGATDAPNAEKFRVFVQFASRMRLPILMLSNSSGFIPGTKQERIRIQAVGAEALDTSILSRMPVVSVVLNQSFGGRQIQAFGRLLRPGIFAMARENALMAVLGPQAAFDLLKGRAWEELMEQGRTEEAETMKKNFIEERLEMALAKNDALSSGAIDIVIEDISGLRNKIIEGFSIAGERCGKAFGD